MQENAKKVVIYTDGACSGNPGPGGWGAVLMYGKHAKEIYGGEPHTTNNRMEIMAAIKALETLTRSCEVDIFTDSQYLKNGVTSWIHNWKKNGWRNAQKKPVVNQDLWQELDELSNKHEIKWHWVKAHHEDELNILADKLAVTGRDEMLQIRNAK